MFFGGYSRYPGYLAHFPWLEGPQMSKKLSIIFVNKKRHFLLIFNRNEENKLIGIEEIAQIMHSCVFQQDVRLKKFTKMSLLEL